MMLNYLIHAQAVSKTLLALTFWGRAHANMDMIPMQSGVQLVPTRDQSTILTRSPQNSVQDDSLQVQMTIICHPE